MSGSTERKVPGMAWLSGTGPEGTRCIQCRHAAPKSYHEMGKAICLESRPVRGRRVAFPAQSPSCRDFSFRLDTAPATPVPHTPRR